MKARTAGSHSSWPDRATSLLQRDPVMALLVFLICMAFYAPTLSPSVVVNDGGEMQTQAQILGVTFPTGYPLFILLGWLVSHLPLGGDPAFRVTLLCALCAAGAMAGLYLLLVRELKIAKIAALAAAILMGSAPRLWMHAAAAEVYPLNCLFIVVCTWLLFRWGRGITPLWVVTLAFGLGLAHHISLRLFGPAALAYVLAVEPRLVLRPRKWMPAVAALLLPLALYVYIPIRAAHFMAQPELEGLILGVRKLVASGYVSPHYFANGPLGIVLALDHSKLFLSGNVFDLSMLGDFLHRIAWQFPAVVSLSLMALGLVRQFRQNARQNVYLLLSFGVVTVTGLSFLAVVGEDGDNFIPSYLLMAIWFALGADALLAWGRRIARNTRWATLILTAALLAIPAYNVARHYPEMMERRQLDVGPQARQVLSQPIPQGALVAGYWNDITPLRYIQRAEGLRPDVWIVATNATGVHKLMERAISQHFPFYTVRPTVAGLRLLPLPVWEEGSIVHPTDQRVSDAVSWRGYELTPQEARAGDVLQLALYWQVDAPVGQDWITFIQIFDEGGEKVAQVDQMPGNELYPPSAWQPGLLLADQYEIGLPADLPAGRYSIIFGWYWDGERLAWADGLDTHALAEIILTDSD